MLFGSLCVTMGETAALSLIRLTRPRASANTWRGVSQPLVAADAAPAMQQRQKRRRDRERRADKVAASFLTNPTIAVRRAVAPSVAWVRLEPTTVSMS